MCLQNILCSLGLLVGILMRLLDHLLNETGEDYSIDESLTYLGTSNPSAI